MKADQLTLIQKSHELLLGAEEMDEAGSRNRTSLSMEEYRTYKLVMDSRSTSAPLLFETEDGIGL